MTTSWMDCNERLVVGDIVFCAEILDENTGVRRLLARRNPSSKNSSGERILRGSCGSTNNVNCEAIGAGIARRMSERTDSRCQVGLLPDDDARVIALCDEMGVRT